MNRRQLLALAVLSIPAAITGCASGSATPNQLATDVNLVATGLSAAITSIAAIPGVPPATVAQLQGYLATIKADAAEVASATAAPAVGTIREIAQIVQAVAPIALSLVPGGSALVPVINAAVSMAPELLAAAGITGAISGPAPVYSPEQARLILASVKAK